MNQPWRLANGEMLYSDVRHIYGPLSPYIHSILYRLFGASLNVLYGSGIVTAILIIGLCYWLSRQLMNRPASLAATLSVMWLCAFKQAGNYILPYSYSALHGCALGLLTLALLVLAVKSIPPPQATLPQDGSVNSLPSTKEPSVAQIDANPFKLLPTVYYLLLAGAFAALTLLAKTEMGVAAIAVGLVTSIILAYPNFRRVLALTACFLLPAIIISLAAYGYIISIVGWQVFANESFLLLQNVPPELVYFNKRMSGFDRPMQSIVSIAGTLIRIILLAIAVGSISQLLAKRKSQEKALRSVPLVESGRAKIINLWFLLLLSIALMLSLSFAGIMEWDNGPYLAMPILLVFLLIPEVKKFYRQIAAKEIVTHQTLLLIAFGSYALTSLARVLLRVRSGGAYSSYLLPVSVILFTYILSYQLTDFLKDGRARLFARNIAIGLIMADAIITSGLLAYRYRTRNTYPIVTARGTMLAVPDLGKAFEQAIAYINRETKEGEAVAVMPEGTSLLFLTNRTNPLREEITTPGFLDRAGEERAIRQLSESNTKLILIANRATSEFGATIFGRDYCQHLMGWIKENFAESEVFSPEGNVNFQIGDKVFFLKAYRKKSS